MLDTDVVFWRSAEDWNFGDALFAGALFPEQTGRWGRVPPRLHPSLFWVPDVSRLREAIAQETQRRGSYWDFAGPTQPELLEDGTGFFYDTLAPLWEAFRDRAYPFGERELDCYDHLMHGSHLALFSTKLDPEFEAILRGHRAVLAGDIAAVKGIWREQLAYYSKPNKLELWGHRHLDIAQELNAAQGLTLGDEEVLESVRRLKARWCYLRKKKARGIPVGRLITRA